MNRWLLAAVVVVVLACAAVVRWPETGTERSNAALSLVREMTTVAIGGQLEEWRLVWGDKPVPICSADEVETAITCPCMGTAYGEMGHLALERRQAGSVVDSLALGRVYGEFGGVFDFPHDFPEGMIALRSKPVGEHDYDFALAPPGELAAEVARRPDTPVMQFADYDHDGNASEFLLQVGTMPCGKLQFVAIGISRADPRLHALGSAAHPERPLAMPQQAWEALLRRAERQRVLTWECDDHMSQFHSEFEVSAADGAISAKLLRFRCPFDQATDRRPDLIEVL